MKSSRDQNKESQDGKNKRKRKKTKEREMIDVKKVEEEWKI